jgi:anti-sigma factor RsiW
VSKSSLEHITEEELEKYHLHQLSESAAEAVEEHLLLCEHCQTQLEDLEVFTESFRAVAPILAREDAREQRGGIADWLRRQLQNPFPALAWGAAAALALFLVPLRWSTSPASGPLATIELQAVRASVIPHAPASRPLRFRLDLSGLPPSASFRAELTQDNGKTITNRSLFLSETTNTRDLADGLAAGRYWLRIYAPKQTEPLREFGFTVQ